MLRRLGFGRLESIRIQRGAVILDPCPTVIQILKFGSTDHPEQVEPAAFELKMPLAQLFEFIRGVEDGEIRCLEVRHGLPFSIEIERRISRGMPDVKGEHVEAV